MTELSYKLYCLRDTVLRTLRREEGGVTVETVIVMPLLAAFYCATFVWFDAFRQKTLIMKSSYAVSDVLSRQSQVDEDFLDNMLNVLAYMIPSGQPPDMRVSLIEYNENVPGSESKYRLRWSYSPSSMEELTQQSIDLDSTWIPVMGDLDAVVVTETAVPYKPIFRVGLNDTTYINTFITRPRFDLSLLKTDEPVYYSNADDRDNDDALGEFGDLEDDGSGNNDPHGDDPDPDPGDVGGST